MAKNKSTNYQDMSKEELLKMVGEEKKKYHRLQFNHAVSPLANPIELRDLRRNVAKLMTALTNKNNS